MNVGEDRTKKNGIKISVSSPATTKGIKTDNLNSTLNIYINEVQQDNHLKHRKNVPLGAD